MASLWDQMADGATAGAALELISPKHERYSLADLLDRAERTAAQITVEASAPRRIAILMTNGEPFVRACLAAIRGGAAAVPVALPVGFGASDHYLAYIRRITADAEIDALLVDESTSAFATTLAETLPSVEIVDVQEPPTSGGQIEVVSEGRDEALAVIQYTSGSTSAPKGVPLSHDNVAAGLLAINRGVGWQSSDRAGIWLPLYHDMGLFGLLQSLAFGGQVTLWRPTDFVRGPGDWLASASLAGVTIVPAPNFAYDYMARAAADGLPAAVDLAQWRVAMNGAEPVQASTIDRVLEVLGPHGLAPEALTPVYGLAEATLAATFSNTLEPPRFKSVARESLREGSRVELTDGSDGSQQRRVACVGRPVPGISLRIGGGGEDGRADGIVGEIELRGPAVMKGYLGVPPHQQPVGEGGWLRTGDLGFTLDGELYVVGRLKDMVIVNGQNYYPEDVEEIVRSVPSLTRRHCVAVDFEEGDRETMVILFETRLEGADAQAIAKGIEVKVATELGLTSVRALAVSPRTIPHTPSGKVQRKAARVLCEREALVDARRG